MRLAPSTSTSSTAADALGVPLGRDPLHDVDQPLEPLVLDLLRHLVWHLGRLRAVPRRVDEREGAVVAHLLDDRERLPEVRPPSRPGSRR